MIVQKYLAEKGICSRKEAEAFFRSGLILVNGQKALPGVDITDTDVVTLAPEAVAQLAEKTTVAVYKPRGIVCSLGEGEGARIQDAFPQYKELSIVGRLDKESEGLLLLTNDGLITKAVTGDAHTTEKEYEVTVRETLSTETIAPFESGLTLSDGPTLPATAALLSPHTFRIVIKEGRNRQIRRMCGAINLTVQKLKRIRIGGIQLESMQPGDSRELTSEEVHSLKSSA